MCNLFYKTQRSFFLSNILRKYFYFIVIYFVFVLPLSAQWLEAYIPDFKVNDDNLNSYQTNSQIGVDTAGNFVIVWRDVRNNPGTNYPSQVFCQRYNKNGFSLGSNYRVGQDTTTSPNVIFQKSGTFIITWLRTFFVNSFQRYELYFQKFSNNGISITQPIRISDTSYNNGAELFNGMSISVDSLGRFVVCWSQQPSISSPPNIYFQRFDSNGIKIGTIDSVNEAYSYAEGPSIASSYDGSFIISWKDNRYNIMQLKYDIYIQRYTPNGIKIGNNTKVNDDNQALQFRGGAEITTNGNGYYAIAWNDPRNCGNGEIYYQLIKPDGSFLGVNRKANSSPCGAGTNSRKISMRSDRYFYIAWSDWFYSGREQVYGRKFDSTGNPIGNAYMIPSTSPANTEQRTDDVYLLRDRVYTTWTDNRNGGSFNYDIYCNVRGFQNPDTVIGMNNNSGISNQFRLNSPYPNPFNPVSTIKYDIPKQSQVTIKIFDIIGREIATLVNETKEPGYYSVSFDGTNYSSGVYFYRIDVRQAGSSTVSFTNVKKMVLLK